MSKIAISAKNLSKIYRLYTKTHYRLLDAFGLLRKQEGAYTKHAALDNINIEISRGEKVAVIGRNGAGKSTFLKLVCGAIQPTQGTMEIFGSIHALLEIGTGFHSDFTGRENVHAYLANWAIIGEEAEQKTREIINFAELEEYIDQPMKTYSTGMGVRLMFATSTAVLPDILVLDEVLSVGDAYFTQKSYDKIRHMCQGDSTLLLVTHDVYSALNLCERFIWIDRGKVRQDGPGEQVVHAYEASIRDQEEKRLRSRRLAVLEENLKNKGLLYGQISCNQEKKGKILFSQLSFAKNEEILANINIEANAKDQEVSLILDSNEGNWGEIVEWHGCSAREFLHYGSIYHKLPFIIHQEKVLEALEQKQLSLKLNCFCDHPQEISCFLFHPYREEVFKAEISLNQKDQWQQLIGLFEKQQDEKQQASAEIVRYGKRSIEITNVEFLNEQDELTHQYTIGEVMKIRLSYCINDKTFDEHPAIIVAFQKGGIVRTHRFWTDKIHLKASEKKQGTIEIVANPLLLGRGHYAITVSIFKENYLTEQKPKQFFTASNQLYDLHSRAYEIVVVDSMRYPLYNDIVFQHPSTWRLNEKEVVASTVHKEK